MRQSYFIYKYIKDNKIIYIGKTKRPLNERVNEHKKDLPKDCDIYYFECISEADMNIAELFLIDKYRPEYNKDCISDSIKTSFNYTEPEWRPLSVYYTPVKIFKGFKRQDGIKKVFYNSKTGKESIEKISYCECDVDFPEILKHSDFQYTICTECGRIVRNSFKFFNDKKIYI